MKTKAGIVSLRVSMTKVMQLVCCCGGRNDFLRFIPSFLKSFFVCWSLFTRLPPGRQWQFKRKASISFHGKTLSFELSLEKCFPIFCFGSSNLRQESFSFLGGFILWHKNESLKIFVGGSNLWHNETFVFVPEITLNISNKTETFRFCQFSFCIIKNESCTFVPELILHHKKRKLHFCARMNATISDPRPSRKAFGQTKALSEGLLSEIDGKFPKQKRNFQIKFSLTKAENTGPLARDFSGQRPVRSRSEISMENCPETSSVRDEPTLHTFCSEEQRSGKSLHLGKSFCKWWEFFPREKEEKGLCGKKEENSNES